MAPASARSTTFFRPKGMACISNTLCADEDHLDYLRQKQASYGSGNVWDTAPGSQQGASRPSGQASRPPPTNPPVDLGDPAKRFCECSVSLSLDVSSFDGWQLDL